jgi:hypothetical protein
MGSIIDYKRNCCEYSSLDEGPHSQFPGKNCLKFKNENGSMKDIYYGYSREPATIPPAQKHVKSTKMEERFKKILKHNK